MLVKAHSSRLTRPRARFTDAVRFFVSKRRCLDALVGLVGRRCFGGFTASRIISIKRATASLRLSSCVRNCRAVITKCPDAVMRRPARAFRRKNTAFDNARQWRASNRSCTADSVLLTFWPPGPDARRNTSSISVSSMEMVGVTSIISDQ